MSEDRRLPTHGELGTVVLTGGTGSFGRAFVRHVLRHNPVTRIVSVSRNAELRYRLEQDVHDDRLIVVPGDVRVLADLEAAYDEPIDVLIHAAAEKHVTTGERHAHYVRAINVDGAQNVITFARQRRIARVIALSTDKACAPINAYGRSKAEAEHLFTRQPDPTPVWPTRYAVVRYGNVVGSSGSVIPLFIRQRAEGRVTITDRRMTRFFLALSDEADLRVYQDPGRQAVRSAVGLVLYALDHMVGGEIYVPQIPSGTIANLAAELAPACRIEEVGIRPGEKLHEDLIAADESHRCWWLGRDGVFALLPTCEAQPPPAWCAYRVPIGFTYTSADRPLPIRIEVEQPV